MNIFLTLQNLLRVNVSKILLLFKRFRVESFVWIRHRVEIFILNFSKYRVFTRTHAPGVCLAISQYIARCTCKPCHWEYFDL
jgi:hypothetical protein